MPIDLQTIAGRQEIQNLYKTLSKLSDVESIVIDFVSKAQDETEAINRANEIEYKLRTLFTQRGGDECPPGTIYNPVTGDCE